MVTLQIQWNDKLLIGYEEMDKDHKLLIDSANRFIYMHYSGEAYEVIMDQLDVLINNICEHFNNEEKFLIDIGFSDYENHVASHKKLIEKSLKLKEDYKNKKINTSTFFSFIVDDVIVDHTLKEDGRFFKTEPDS